MPHTTSVKGLKEEMRYNPILQQQLYDWLMEYLGVPQDAWASLHLRLYEREIILNTSAEFGQHRRLSPSTVTLLKQILT